MATSQAASENGLFQLSSSSDRIYTAVNLNEWLENLKSNGILLRNESLTTQLQCSPSSGTMNTTFDEGVAHIEGHMLIFTSTETATALTHSTADVTNPRIDLIVLEKNTDSGTRSDSIKIVEGTPAASPSEPSLTQSSTIWQEKLYSVLIPAGETDADNFTYTDNRSNLIAYDIVDVADATTTTKGIVELATDAEGEAGINTTKAMTPASTKAAIEELVPNLPFCETYYTGVSITSSGFVLWNNDRYDDDDMHDTSSNQQYVVAQNSNEHKIDCLLTHEVSSGTGSLIIYIRVYNASNVEQRAYKYYSNVDSVGDQSFIMSLTTYLNSGEKIAIEIFGVSATSYILGGTGGDEYSYLTVKEVK